MAHTPWIGGQAVKLYLQSGQFTSTLKTSQYLGDLEPGVQGISFDGIDTPWTGGTNEILWLQSGQFTSTVKTSEFVGSIDLQPNGITYDGTNTPWIGDTEDKLYLQSGQFTSTVKTSEFVGGVDVASEGVSWDGTNTPWCGLQDIKLYLQSGQFTATIKTSLLVSAIEGQPTGVSWDGTNTPWCGSSGDRLYLQSGQFTSTMKTSQLVSGIDTYVYDICTNDYYNRLGIPPVYEKSLISTLTITDQIVKTFIAIRSLTSILTITDQITPLLITSQSITSVLSLIDQVVEHLPIARRSIISPLSLTDGINLTYPKSLTSILSLDQSIISIRLSSQELYDIKLHWPRWIFASASKHFDSVAQANDIHYFIEGTHRKTQGEDKYIEFRMDGPHITEMSKGYYRLDIEINILWSFHKNNENFHEASRLSGILFDAMGNICIYRYGSSLADDSSLLGVLQLQQEPVRINNFGEVRPDVRLTQGTVEGSYTIKLSC